MTTTLVSFLGRVARDKHGGRYRYAVFEPPFIATGTNSDKTR